jgi:predicted DNA-binding protein with PD1-like motif
LNQALLTICHERQIRCATVQATGVLDELSVAHYDRAARSLGQVRLFRSSLHLLAASGTISEESGRLQLTLNVTASRQRDNGVELLGGLCLSAKVVSCEIIIDAMDDLILRRAVDKGTGLHTWTEHFAASAGAAPVVAPAVKLAEAKPAEARPAEERPPLSRVESQATATVVESKQSWADAVMASVRAEAETPAVEDRAPEDEYRPVRPGDLLDHQQFGRCVVQRVDSDQETVTVRLRNNRLVRLNLEVLHVRYQGEEEGHQVFVTGGD